MPCLFCQIIAKEIPSTKVLETDNVLVIKDIHPKAPTHLLIIPKRHIESILYANEADKPLLGEIMYTAKKLADRLQISEEGVTLVIRNGRNAGQEIDHLHVHFLSNRK